MDADHLSAAQADSREDIGTSRGRGLRGAIENLVPGCPIAEYLADSASHHADRANELLWLRQSQESLAATLAKGSELLSGPATANEGIIQLAAYRNSVIYRIEALELAHKRECRNHIRLAMQRAEHQRAEVAEIELPALPALFNTEKKCQAYLRRWQEHRGLGCPVCGARSAYFISDRAVHECEACEHQRSIREETLYFGSHIPLRKWFSAIQVLLDCPEVTTHALGKHLGIPRIDTVRKLRSQIQNALSSPKRTMLLAGLDVEFGIARPVQSAHEKTLKNLPRYPGRGLT